MRILARKIESSDDVAIDCLQRRDAGEFNRAAVFCRVRQKLSRGQDGWQILLALRDCPSEVGDSIAQGCQIGPVG